MQIKQLSSLVIFLLISCFLSCQTTDEKYYMKEIYKNCDNPDIVEIEYKTDYVEIEYLCKGKLYELVIDKKSDTFFTESETDASSISTVMLKKIKKNYPEWTIDEYTQVWINDTTLYKVELVKDGIEQNVYFTLTGKLYKAKNFLASDKWNSAVLKNNTIYLNCPYNLLNPSLTFELPDILKEISGLSIKSAGLVYCIQDEIGSVFLYNLNTGLIEEIYRFSDVGDFEDITHFNGTVYVLRSDGALFSVNLNDYPKNIQMEYIPFQALNIEGVFYDAGKESFIIACNEGNITDNINKRNIYRFSPKKKTNNLTTELSISIEDVNDYFKKHYPEIKVSSINFSPSAVAVHPITGDYYILSATDRMVIIYDANKKFKSIFALPSDVFYKPEGISFYSNGDLFISNEGTKNGLIKPTILFFKYVN
ncbi:MAG: SdiA-regulated domain-containing protein [Bacteroidales bacterium]|nr:SdiA-regulated domain-containing protein [Bacteroidales bacterium]